MFGLSDKVSMIFWSFICFGIYFIMSELLSAPFIMLPIFFVGIGWLLFGISQ